MDHSITSPDALFDAWRADLSGWGVPEAIQAAAPESPWGFPGKVFARRAESQILAREGVSYQRASEALPDGGTLMDVGAGAGAASLPHADRASRIVAVDTDPDMLAALAGVVARNPGFRAQVEVHEGAWPAIAPQVPIVDVVVCHHVLYNVADLRAFVEALTAHAVRRVVVELTDRHPMAPMGPLWRQFHGLERPEGPSAAQAAQAIAALGLDVGMQRWGTAPLHLYDSMAEMVAFHRRRLCLPASEDPAVAAALEALGVDPQRPVGLGAGRPMVTLWWPGAHSTAG